MRPLRVLPVALLATGSLAAAVPAVPKLDSAATTFFQRGTTNTVRLDGDALASVTDFLPSGPGWQILPSPVSPPSVVLEGSLGGITVRPTDPAKVLTLRVVIAPDAPLGSRELRVAGPGGVSNPLTLQITDLPEILEPAAVDPTMPAPLLTLPVGVSGRISASPEVDRYRFKARAGEELSFDVQANRTGSPLDATLVLLDAQGREVARSEDAHGLDPFLVFTAPADGEYTLKLQDLRFQGGADYRYHLVAGPIPYLESLFPFGGRRGSVVDVQLLGHRLAGADRLTLALAADAPVGRQELRARTAAGSSNPVGFEVGTLPDVLEVEPNDVPEKAQAITGALAVNGRLGKAGDLDVFRFRSATDQRWIAEVVARRFGSPLDALLTVTDAAGKVIQRNDDANGPDARVEFDAKKDTDYLISLRDLTDRGGDRFGYRLMLQVPDTTPDFAVRANAGRLRVHRGGWLAVRCDATRRNGYDGILRVNGAALPPQVTVVPLALGAGDDAGWILIGAAEEAAGTFFPLRLAATGERDGRSVLHDVTLPEAGWLTLLPPAPFSVDVGRASALVEQNGTTMLDVAVTRAAGFEGEIKVVGEGPGGVSLPALVLPAGKSRGQLTVQAAYNAATGTRPMLVRAEANVEGQTLVQAAPRLVDLTVQPIPLFATAMLPGSPFFRTDAVRLSAVALPTNSTSAANRTEFVVKVERRGFDGEVELALEGVPKGVVATVHKLAAKANEATIQLLVTEQAETGKDHSLRVATVAQHQDRVWRQKTQPITLTLLAPAVETAALAPTNAAPTAPAAPPKP
jgi:hypothetical protein